MVGILEVVAVCGAHQDQTKQKRPEATGFEVDHMHQGPSWQWNGIKPVDRVAAAGNRGGKQVQQNFTKELVSSTWEPRPIPNLCGRCPSFWVNVSNNLALFVLMGSGPFPMLQVSNGLALFVVS